jgi:hypothetical protein
MSLSMTPPSGPSAAGASQPSVQGRNTHCNRVERNSGVSDDADGLCLATHILSQRCGAAGMIPHPSSISCNSAGLCLQYHNQQPCEGFDSRVDCIAHSPLLQVVLCSDCTDHVTGCNAMDLATTASTNNRNSNMLGTVSHLVWQQLLYRTTVGPLMHCVLLLLQETILLCTKAA